MSTIGSSLSASSTTASGSSASSVTGASGLASGSSTYSKDLQGSVTRAIQIASLPITLLQGQQDYLNAQSGELATMDGLFSKLQGAAQGIQKAMTGSSFETDISDTDVVSATLGDGALEGVYSIEVKDIGAYATSITKSAWNSTETVPGKADAYHLVVGEDSYDLAPVDDSAAAVASAINANYGSMVNATVVNVGTNDSPSYRVSLRSATLGAMTLDIQTSTGASLQKAQTPGSLAEYVIDNSGSTVTSNSRNVKISDGVTLQLLASAPDHPVNVTVMRSTSVLSDALSSFAGAYNSVVSEIAGQRGQSGGALQGETILTELQRTLSAISTYSSGGQISGLPDLGLALNDDGTLTYNQWTLISADIGNSTAVSSFIGSADSGFLKSVTASINRLESASTGLLKNAETSLKSQITAMSNKIAAKQSEVDQLQITLNNQMAAADAMISAIQQQFTVISNMFSAMDTANKLYAS